MAQIWIDANNSMNNISYDNANQPLRFIWQFVTLASETQDAAQIRWRKMGYDNTSAGAFTITAIATGNEDLIWPAANYAVVGKQAFSYGFNITSIDFPIGTLSTGIWAFQVNTFVTGASDWSGWSAPHRIEITPFDTHQTQVSSATSLIKTPHAQNEGPYSARVEVVSAAGVTAVSSEQAYRLWETNKYLKDSTGAVVAVPENWNNGNTTVRVERTN